MREPRNTQNTRKNGEVESGGVWSGGVDFHTEILRHGGEWFGDVPEKWVVKRLASYFSERKVKVSDKFFSPLSVTKNGVLPQLENVAKSDDGDNRKLVRKGDFVINSRSDRKGSSGVSNYDGSVSLINLVLKPRGDLFGSYCNYLLKSLSFVEENYRNGRGIVADLWTTRYDEMKMIKVAMPPLSEQRAIVKYLDAETRRIDKAIAAEEKMIALLQERREIVINEAVGGQCGSEGVGSGGVDFNAEAQRCARDEVVGLPERSEPGGAARRRGMELKKLKAILKCFGRIGFRGYGTNDIVDENEGAITLSPSNINEWQMDFSKCTYLSWQKYEESPEIIVEMNDIIFVKTGAGFGKCAMVKSLPMECTINPQLVIFKKIKENTKYLMYLLQTEEAKRQVNFSVIGGTIPTIAQSKIGNYAFLFPSLSEQEEIVKYLDAETGKIDRAIEVKRQQIELLRERRQIVIDEAVTGKVRVA